MKAFALKWCLFNDTFFLFFYGDIHGDTHDDDTHNDACKDAAVAYLNVNLYEYVASAALRVGAEEEVVNEFVHWHC
jgi:hypothetical protein